MELILSILILALACTACVRIFAAARIQRMKAREFNHIQELTVSAGEALEGWNGVISSYIRTFAEPADITDNLLLYYYDSDWNTCKETSAQYTMTIQLNASETEKSADINFCNAKQECLYQLSVTFPSNKENLS